MRLSKGSPEQGKTRPKESRASAVPSSQSRLCDRALLADTRGTRSFCALLSRAGPGQEDSGSLKRSTKEAECGGAVHPAGPALCCRLGWELGVRGGVGAWSRPHRPA